jgi:hypothetical protein
VLPAGFAPTAEDSSTLIATRRIYAARLADARSVLLEETSGLLSAPGWNPDGRAFAFARVVDSGTNGRRFEVVVQEGIADKRVLFTRPCGAVASRSELVERLTPAWSPDGRYLAIVMPEPEPGLFIIRADNGRLIKHEEGGCWPSWSPDGSRLAFVGRSKLAGASLQILDTTFGPARQVADIGQTFQAPAWSRDGKAVLYISRKSRFRGVGSSDQTELVRLELESGKIEVLQHLNPDQPDRDKAFRGASFSVDRDGDELFYSVDVESQPKVIVWYRPRTRETRDRFNPFDFSVRATALALSPAGKTLALRLGPSGPFGPTAIWELSDNRLTPLVPDESARLEWLTLIIQTCRQLLCASLPPAAAEGHAVERASILPIPGEIASTQEMAFRLRRLARFGRPLCDLPPDAGPIDQELRAFLVEARLFFDYLRDDFDAALASLDAFEAITSSTDQRKRLLSIRAQLFLSKGEIERTKDSLRYLGDLDGRKTLRYEVTPAGVTMTEQPRPNQGWVKYLSQRVQELERARTANTGPQEEPLGNRNPDNPAAFPGLFGPRGGIPQIGPMAPEPGIRFLVPRTGPPGVPPAPRPPAMPRFERKDRAR